MVQDENRSIKTPDPVGPSSILARPDETPSRTRGTKGCKGKENRGNGSRRVRAGTRYCGALLRMTLSQQGVYTLSTNADCRASEDRRFF
jgi:hypothetical protein